MVPLYRLPFEGDNQTQNVARQQLAHDQGVLGTTRRVGRQFSTSHLRLNWSDNEAGRTQIYGHGSIFSGASLTKELHELKARQP